MTDNTRSGAWTRARELEGDWHVGRELDNRTRSRMATHSQRARRMRLLIAAPVRAWPGAAPGHGGAQRSRLDRRHGVRPSPSYC